MFKKVEDNNLVLRFFYTKFDFFAKVLL